jgi:hypothetical protein
VITCSVCGRQNEDLAVVCTSCKGFLQSKIVALNLFETVWCLVESPRTAFRRIVLSQHKNYVVVLSTLMGVHVAYYVIWYKNLGDVFPDLMVLLGAGLAAGPSLGMVCALGFGALVMKLTNMVGQRVSMRNAFAVVAYAGVPVICSLVFVFPVEMAIFGIYFFGTNPSPMVLKPVEYLVLLGLDSLAVVWSLSLLTDGLMVLTGLTRRRAVLATLGLAGVVCACVVALHFL